MKRMYFTLVGTKYYYGQQFLKPNLVVQLIKEPDNKVDPEAIMVNLEGLGKIGYVGNSPHTVTDESYSAGRLYDKIGDTAEGTILYVLDSGALGYVTVSETNVSNTADIASTKPPITRHLRWHKRQERRRRTPSTRR